MKLTGREKTAYGIGAIGKDMVYSLVAGFLMYYYNAVLGISATFIGVLFMAARVFDAFNDPIMGIIVEKTHTPIGKFRPWLIIGTLLNAIILIAMFRVPASLSGSSLLIYTSVAYLLWGMTYTIMDIPYWSMIPAITEHGKDRENISVIARSCAGLGFAVPVALTMVLVPLLGAGSEREGFAKLALIIAALFIVTISITAAYVKEKVKLKVKAPSIREMIGSLMKNDQALVVVVAIVMFNTSLYLTQQLAIYFFKFDIGNAALFGVFGTVGGLAQIIAMMLVPLFRKRLGTKKLLVAAVVTTLIGYSLLLLFGILNIRNIAFLSIAAIIIFMGFGVATVLTTIFLADTVDYGEWKNKHRSESVIFSLQTFVVKLGSAISVFIAGVGLDLIKLDINAVTQTTSTLMGLRFLMIIVPMAGLIATILFFDKKYHLSEERLKAMSAELTLRRVAND
ncbi:MULTISPECIES: glycoside-pentoside-hexuronide (GPH):cation symporter [unclassified Fusibacter]|uniref:glycoside-pentoside-hexuronide (GPH):cation symporter n=1 Tax=unclassified Fusibacter TaxID=2624464 RepID=UPI0010104D9C|nr:MULTISPECIES: glycoside-pentoside-hexuronide (GPH):cation symporter [unclassified Fusibacter]MCK8060085.1 glycoside-pentoside-hexuronide (GPH):cation symporter [Fusibacter sp. A2]NPE22227.1 MFS transporter [Fusibacter sp. A1]RXV61001.1 MFS transporter [Fusibacter sp. A1]